MSVDTVLDVAADTDGIHVAGHPDLRLDPTDAGELIRWAADRNITVIRVDTTGLGWGLAFRLRTQVNMGAWQAVGLTPPRIEDLPGGGPPAVTDRNGLTEATVYHPPFGVTDPPDPAPIAVAGHTVGGGSITSVKRIVIADPDNPNGPPAITFDHDPATGMWSADYDRDHVERTARYLLHALNRLATGMVTPDIVDPPDLPAVPTAADMTATPGLRPPPAVVTGLTTSMTSDRTPADRRTAEAWLNIASWMVAAEYTDDQAHRVADEVAWRVTRCGMAHHEAMESVWADIVARRLRIGPA